MKYIDVLEIHMVKKYGAVFALIAGSMNWFLLIVGLTFNHIRFKTVQYKKIMCKTTVYKMVYKIENSSQTRVREVFKR